MQDLFGIYIHWPFCISKCPYCNFNSHVRIDNIDEERFSLALSKEMKNFRSITNHKQVNSIFIGGGTPSLISPKTVSFLLNVIQDLWNINSKVEITIEANPSNIESERFYGYRSSGVNRISLGIQALDDVSLKILGRIHDAKQAVNSIKLARIIFPIVSFDLIYARPEQKIQQWKKELIQAINFHPDHLSLYQLEIEKGTVFYRMHKNGILKIPNLDIASKLYSITQEITENHGLPAYEISNHAKFNKESQHNLLYWRYHQYAGFGPGAHSRFIKNGLKVATISEYNPKRWLMKVENFGNGILKEEFLKNSQQSDEMLLMGLRLCEGLNIVRYERLSNKSLPEKIIKHLKKKGLIEITKKKYLRATKHGRMFLNYIIKKILIL